MRSLFRTLHPGGASGSIARASSAHPGAAGPDGLLERRPDPVGALGGGIASRGTTSRLADLPLPENTFPGLLPIWRSDWMRLRWIFTAAAVIFLASIAWSLTGAHLRPFALLIGLGEILVFFGMMAGTLFGSRRALPTAGPAAVALVAALTVASIAFVVIEGGVGGVAPFFFAGMMAGRLRPDVLAVRLIGLIAVASVLVMLPFSHDLAGTLVNGLAVGILSLTVYGIRVLQRTNRELLLARDELARYAVAEERLRISRDLHDVLGQDLSVMALKSELARRLLPGDPERAAHEIEDIEHTAREALRAVRETVSGYRQPMLAVELAGAREALTAAGIELAVEGQTDALPAPVEAILAWTVREGTTNVIRHSGARRCRVRVDRGPSMATVELVDDGTGTGARGEAGRRLPAPDRGAARVHDAGQPGSGLPGLAERVAASGGVMEAGPRPDGGFRLRVSVPLPAGSMA